MALLDTESWGWLGGVVGNDVSAVTTALGLRGWTDQISSSSIKFATGPFTGTLALTGTDNSSATPMMAKVSPFPSVVTNGDRMVMGFRVKVDSSFAAFQRTLIDTFGATADIFSFGYIAGKAFWFRGSTTTTVADGAWHYVEIRHDVAGGLLSSYLYIDGVLIDSAVNYRGWTGPSNPISLRIWEIGNGANGAAFADLYWLDGTGSTHNDVLGPVRVECRFPSADGGTHTMTPNSGSAHWSRVNEAPEDALSSYLSGNLGKEDLFVHQALVSGSGTPQGVNVIAIADRDSVPPRSLAVELYDGAATAVGPDVALSSAGLVTFSPTLVRKVFDVDPQGNPWTISSVNNAQMGVKVTV